MVTDTSNWHRKQTMTRVPLSSSTCASQRPRGAKSDEVEP
jgi:hypothetical protein